MKIGRKSIVKTLTFRVPPYKEKITFKIQANKNHGICDMDPRIGELLTDFQGRQIDDERVMFTLEVRIADLLRKMY